MSELIVQPGYWNWLTSSNVESFLAAVSILLGLTQKRKNFLEQVHKDIHGRYQPDEYYRANLKNMGRLPPHMVLQRIMKYCNTDQKKQLKIWYTELLAMEPMNEVSPLCNIMLPVLSNTIDEF